MNSRKCRLNASMLWAAAVSVISMVTPTASATPPTVSCWTITSQICEACPWRRTWFCISDIDGAKTSCTEYEEPCGAGECQRAEYTTGPGCPPTWRSRAEDTNPAPCNARRATAVAWTSSDLGVNC